MGQWKNFSGVGKRNRTLPGRIECSEDEDKKRNTCQVSSGLFRDVEAEAGSQQGPGHVWEGEEQQSSTTESVDSGHSGKGEKEVHKTKSPGGKKSPGNTGPCLLEDSRRIEGDNVDTTHLLCDHYCETSKGGTPNPGNSEQFSETTDVITRTRNVMLDLDLSIDVVQIACSLQSGIAQTTQRLICVAKLALLDVPTRGFWTEINPEKQRHGWDKSRAQLKSPRDIACVLDSKVCRATKENTESCP